MWRRLGDNEETVELRPSDCLTIPVGTRFQFRSVGRQPLVAVGVTMPPWPGDGEAIESEGHGTDGAAGARTGCRCPPLTPGKLS